jgi:hypothetical protein
VPDPETALTLKNAQRAAIQLRVQNRLTYLLGAGERTVTRLMIEHLGPVPSRRDLRVLELLRRRAVDMLAGRTIWSIAVLPSGRADAEALRTTLRGPGEEAATVRALTPETAVEQRAEAGDLVLLHDELAATQVSAARDCGAHAVLLVGPSFRAGAAGRGTDAYVLASSRALGRGLVGERLAAFMPSADVVAAFARTRESAVPEPPDEVSWNTVLAEVVQTDRVEAVGGRLHARPAVALR